MTARNQATQRSSQKSRVNGKAAAYHEKPVTNGKGKPKSPQLEFFVDPLPIGDPSDSRDLGDGIYWIGVDTQDAFRCNPYLIIDGDEAVLIDPGGLLTAQGVIARAAALVDLTKVRYIIGHHQDPDVISSVNYLRPLVHPSCKIVCHSRMSVLIKHSGSGFQFLEVDKSRWQITFGRGRQLTFAHTPYLHSPGAIVT